MHHGSPTPTATPDARITLPAAPENPNTPISLPAAPANPQTLIADHGGREKVCYEPPQAVSVIAGQVCKMPVVSMSCPHTRTLSSHRISLICACAIVAERDGAAVEQNRVGSS